MFLWSVLTLVRLTRARPAAAPYENRGVCDSLCPAGYFSTYPSQFLYYAVSAFGCGPGDDARGSPFLAASKISPGSLIRVISPDKFLRNWEKLFISPPLGKTFTACPLQAVPRFVLPSSSLSSANADVFGLSCMIPKNVPWEITNGFTPPLLFISEELDPVLRQLQFLKDPQVSFSCRHSIQRDLVQRA
jgi:hypothetical protein